MAITDQNLYSIDAGILPKDASVIIVRTEWNNVIVSELEKGCKKILDQYKVQSRVITVPGAFEISFAIKSYWESVQQKFQKPQAFIALGCVLRGDTPHFEYVCKAVTDGIVFLNLHIHVPTIFGILTVDNQQQAQDRVGGSQGHKGEEAALTAVKMIALQQSFYN